MGFLFGALALFIVIGIAMVNQESTMDEVEKRIEEERKKEPKPDAPTYHVDSNPFRPKQKVTKSPALNYIVGVLYAILALCVFVFIFAQTLRVALGFSIIMFSMFLSGIFLFAISAKFEDETRFFIGHIGGLFLGGALALIILKNFL